MDIKRETRQYSLVTLDITNHCNARCKFCYNVFGKEHNMDMETFHKALQILPYTKEGCFLLSSLYEPTLNPLFFDMLSQIPRQYKNKVFLTTNLAGNISEGDFVHLAESQLHHIDISLLSYEQETYKNLTQMEDHRFFENLETIHRIFSRYPKPPRLQLNTMILKSNYGQILDLAKRAHEELNPYAHIFNTPATYKAGENVLLTAEVDSTDIVAELLPKEQLTALYDELTALGYKNLIVDISNSLEAYHEKQDIVSPRYPHDAYALHITSNGQGLFLSDENPFDLADIDHPFVFFSKALTARQTYEAAKRELAEAPPLRDHSEDPDFHSFVDTLTIWDEQFIWLHGWAFHRQVECGPLYVVVKAAGNQVVYETVLHERADVVEVFEDESRRLCGFECLIDPQALSYEPKQNYEVFVGVLHEGTLYTKHLTDLAF
ncbi:hypothetical protein LJC49_04300 [Ruminococcaceae bacterium OttesenSCG-928-I18]|nr:hypothetical protein [Ruminococcaceae bacterium OttesenSCG-928-I18]